MVAVPINGYGPARVTEAIERLLTDLFDVEGEDLGPNTCFSEDLGMDSLHVLALVAQLGGLLQIELDLEQIDDVATVA